MCEREYAPKRTVNELHRYCTNEKNYMWIIDVFMVGKFVQSSRHCDEMTRRDDEMTRWRRDSRFSSVNNILRSFLDVSLEMVNNISLPQHIAYIIRMLVRSLTIRELKERLWADSHSPPDEVGHDSFASFIRFAISLCRTLFRASVTLKSRHSRAFLIIIALG